jgi:hypothetical protein
LKKYKLSLERFSERIILKMRKEKLQAEGTACGK